VSKREADIEARVKKKKKTTKAAAAPVDRESERARPNGKKNADRSSSSFQNKCS
jgi:hypothetical protein